MQHELVVSQKMSAAVRPIAEHPPTFGNPKKRRPFSFSRGFDAQGSASDLVGGAGDDFDFQSYEKMASFQNQEGGRSPRVHFAEPLQLDINESTDKKLKTKDQPLKMNTVPESDGSQLEQRNRGRSASLDVPQCLDGEKPFELVKDSNQSSINNSKSVSSDHKLRMELSQTDDLLKNVGNFVADFAAARTKNFPVPLNFSYSPTPLPNKLRQEVENKRKLDIAANTSVESVEGLDTIQCPSVVMMESARSNLFSPNQSFSAPGGCVSG